MGQITLSNYSFGEICTIQKTNCQEKNKYLERLINETFKEKSNQVMYRIVDVVGKDREAKKRMARVGEIR